MPKTKTKAKPKVKQKTKPKAKAKSTTKIKIENVVASTDIKKIISLDRLLQVLDSSEYEPEQFPGLVYRLKEPKVATLIF